MIIKFFKLLYNMLCVLISVVLIAIILLVFLAALCVTLYLGIAVTIMSY